MILQALALAEGDRLFLRLEVDLDLRVRVAGAVPAGQRVGPKRLLPLELQQPQAVVGLAGLGRAAVELGDTGDRHQLRKWPSTASESSRRRISTPGRSRTRLPR